MTYDILVIRHSARPPVSRGNQQRRLPSITTYNIRIYLPTLYDRTNNENLETDERWCHR